jgi:hypothetical protein
MADIVPANGTGLPAEPAYDAPEGPQAPVEAVPEGQPPPAEETAPEASPHDDVLERVKAATQGAADLALATGTGEVEQIDVQALDAAMSAVLKGCQAIAVLDPPPQPLSPRDQLQNQLDANKALLQDHQHAEQMRVQEETAKQREGRPQGPAKP